MELDGVRRLLKLTELSGHEAIVAEIVRLRSAADDEIESADPDQRETLTGIHRNLTRLLETLERGQAADQAAVEPDATSIRASTARGDISSERADPFASSIAREVTQSASTTAAGVTPLSVTRQRDLPVRAPAETSAGGERRIASPLAPGPELTAGEVLAGRFEVVRELGRGGMGVVYEAIDRQRSDAVAIKLLQSHLLHDEHAVARFRDEARIAGGLAHPHIVRVHDLHVADGRTFLAMELLKGRSLRDEINIRAQESRRFAVEEVRRIAGQLCAALLEAHRHTVHRDIKPENIWLCDDGSVKLMDFGIARLLRPSQFTTTGLALGTAYYMAPEQLHGGGEVDSRADQYAMGVVLYELLTGKVPIGVIKSPHEVRKSVPPGISRAVMKALEGQGKDRHAGISAFANALNERPRGRRVAVMMLGASTGVAAVTVVALAAGGYKPWSSWLAATAFAPGSPRQSGDNAGVAAAPPVDTLRSAPVELGLQEKEARLNYERQLGRVEELLPLAARVNTEIDTAVTKATEDERQRERDLAQAKGAVRESVEQTARAGLERAKSARRSTEKVAAIWREHPQRQLWIGEAKGHVNAARALATEHSYAEAVAELRQAESKLETPLAWLDNARQAAALTVAQVEVRLEGLLHTAASSDPAFYAYPISLLKDVDSKLLVGDGGAGFSRARDAAKAVEEVAGLWTLRASALTSRERIRPVMESDAMRGQPLRADYEQLAKRLTAADEATRSGRLADLPATYQNIDRELGSVWQTMNSRPDTLLILARAKARAHARDDAIALLNSCLRLDARNQEGLALRATLNSELGQIDPVIEDCSKLAQIAPDDVRVYELRSRAYLRKNNLDRALADATEALRLEKTLERFLHRVTCRAAKQDDDRGIVGDCTDALTIDRDNTAALQARAEALARLKQHGKAAEDYALLARLVPSNDSFETHAKANIEMDLADARINPAVARAGNLLSEKKYRDAIATLETLKKTEQASLGRHPEVNKLFANSCAAETRRLLDEGSAAFESQQYQDAVTLATDALAFTNKGAQDLTSFARDLRGRSRYHLKQYKSAWPDLDIKISVNKGLDNRNYYYQGLCRMALRDYPGAAHAFSHAVHSKTYRDSALRYYIYSRSSEYQHWAQKPYDEQRAEFDLSHEPHGQCFKNIRCTDYDRPDVQSYEQK